MRKGTETEAKAQVVSLSKICDVTPFSQEFQPVVDNYFITQLKTHGVHDPFSAKHPSDETDIHIAGFFFLSSIPQVNLMETNSFGDFLKGLPTRAQLLDLVQEQQTEKNVREVTTWKNRLPQWATTFTDSITKLPKTL